MTANVQTPIARPRTTHAALTDHFADRAGKLGVRVHRVGGLDEIAALAAGLVAADGDAGRGAIIAPGLDAAHPDLRRQLAARGVPLEALDADDPGPTFARVAVGLSGATLGVAETGSLVVADPPADRLVRMLSPRHLVVLDAAAIVPDLDEAGERLGALIDGAGGARANYVSFITGPSRTADIEMSLTVGAHGPAELHVAILDPAVAPA